MLRHTMLSWYSICGGLQVRGSVLGGRQDATLLLTDFPIALLQPVLRAMPGLQHAQPAVGLTGASPVLNDGVGWSDEPSSITPFRRWKIQMTTSTACHGDSWTSWPLGMPV